MSTRLDSGVSVTPARRTAAANRSVSSGASVATRTRRESERTRTRTSAASASSPTGSPTGSPIPSTPSVGVSVDSALQELFQRYPEGVNKVFDDFKTANSKTLFSSQSWLQLEKLAFTALSADQKDAFVAFLVTHVLNVDEMERAGMKFGGISRADLDRFKRLFTASQRIGRRGKPGVKPDEDYTFDVVQTSEDFKAVVEQYDPTYEDYKEARKCVNAQAIRLFEQMMNGDETDETSFFEQEILAKMGRSQFECPVLIEAPRTYQDQEHRKRLQQMDTRPVWRPDVDGNDEILKVQIFANSNSNAKVELKELQSPAYWQTQFQFYTGNKAAADADADPDPTKRDRANKELAAFTANYEAICRYNAWWWDLKFKNSPCRTLLPTFIAFNDLVSKSFNDILKQMDAFAFPEDGSDPKVYDLLATVPLRLQVLSSLSNSDAIVLLASALKDVVDKDATAKAQFAGKTQEEQSEILAKLIKTLVGPRNLAAILSAPQYYCWWKTICYNMHSIPVFDLNDEVDEPASAIELFLRSQLQNRLRTYERTVPDVTAAKLNSRRLTQLLKKGYNTCLADRIAFCSSLEPDDPRAAACVQMPQKCLQPDELLSPFAHMVNSSSTSNPELLMLIASVLNEKVQFPDIDVMPALIPNQAKQMVLEVLAPLTRDRALARATRRGEERIQALVDPLTKMPRNKKEIDKLTREWQKVDAVKSMNVLNADESAYKDVIDIQVHSGGKFKDVLAPFGKNGTVDYPVMWQTLRCKDKEDPLAALPGSIGSIIEEQVKEAERKARGQKPRETGSTAHAQTRSPRHKPKDPMEVRDAKYELARSARALADAAKLRVGTTQEKIAELIATLTALQARLKNAPPERKAELREDAMDVQTELETTQARKENEQRVADEAAAKATAAEAAAEADAPAAAAEAAATSVEMEEGGSYVLPSISDLKQDINDSMAEIDAKIAENDIHNASDVRRFAGWLENILFTLEDLYEATEKKRDNTSIMRIFDPIEYLLLYPIEQIVVSDSIDEEIENQMMRQVWVKIKEILIQLRDDIKELPNYDPDIVDAIGVVNDYVKQTSLNLADIEARRAAEQQNAERIAAEKERLALARRVRASTKRTTIKEQPITSQRQQGARPRALQNLAQEQRQVMEDTRRAAAAADTAAAAATAENVRLAAEMAQSRSKRTGHGRRARVLGTVTGDTGALDAAAAADTAQSQ